MKKILFFGIALLAAMLLPLMVSCSKDKDESGLTVKAEQLYGKWVVTSQVFTDEEGPEALPEKKGKHIVFNQDATGSVSDRRLFEDEIRGGFTWSVSGNQLKITDSTNDISTFTVTSISSTTLQLTWKDEGNIEVTNFTKE